MHGSALIVGEWKYLHLNGPVHPKEEAGWHPPPGQDPHAVNYQLGCALERQPKAVNQSECVASPCLFHVADDPCEYEDVAAAHPDILASLVKRLGELRTTAVPRIARVKGHEGCLPVRTRGAWRPCDAPDPGGGGGEEGGEALPEEGFVEELMPERLEWESGYQLGRGPYPFAAPSSPL